MLKKKNVVDLFCGAGGLSAGFLGGGFRVLLGIDNNSIYLSTFKANHPSAKIICSDIGKITGKKIKKILDGEKVHVIIGGSPCQCFSMAKKRKVNDPRNNLPREFLRIVNETEPDFFLFENVVGILSAKLTSGRLVRDQFVRRAKNIGYNTNYQILNAADFGVPQNRKRVFFIGSRVDTRIKFPLKAKNKAILSSKILIKKNLVPASFFFSKKLIRGFQKRERKNQKNGLGFKWQFLKLGSPSYTIPARYWKDGANALIKYKDGSIRMLTEKECSRIQGFPRRYTFFGNKRQRYEQIGNAVPPPLAAAVAREISKAC